MRMSRVGVRAGRIHACLCGQSGAFMEIRTIVWAEKKHIHVLGCKKRQMYARE